MIYLSLNSSVKLKLYLTLVCSQLMYCTPILHPSLLKDIQNIKRIPHHAAKFILNDYDSNYKTWLFILKLLLLMYLFELQDILFTVKSLKYPTKGFNILHYISFHPIHNLHLVINLSMLIIQPDTCSFIDCHNFGMPSPLLTYISPWQSSKLNSRSTFGTTLYLISMTTIYALFI